jgi:hypothetical protein
MKYCQKMKRSQRASHGSMGRKCDTTRWRGDVGHSRGGTGEGKGGDDVSWVDVNLTGIKMKKIYAVDSVATNGR